MTIDPYMLDLPDRIEWLFDSTTTKPEIFNNLIGAWIVESYQNDPDCGLKETLESAINHLVKKELEKGVFWIT